MLFFDKWRSERQLQRKASQFVDAIESEPASEDVAWLANTATRGDVDHSRWELRYARAALGLLVAQRDALDDRTAAEIAGALGRAMEQDARIAIDRRDLAERQLNERLQAYREAMHARGGALAPRDR